MKANVLDLNGSVMKQIELPEVFEETINNALIKRAVLSIQTAAVQRKGAKKGAGRNYTAVYKGSRIKPSKHRIINNEMSRLPRLKNRRYLSAGKVALVPHAVHGPKAHPLKAEKNPVEYINRAEKRKATKSAIAATCDIELVKKRGHRFGEVALPIVVEGKIEELDRTKKVVELLKKLRLWSDVERAKEGRGYRPGKGKMRGRKYKHAKSVLFVVEKTEKFFRAGRNLEGVDICSVTDLNAKILAPGTNPGRLTVWSEPAIKKLGEAK
ncbi:MAG: 50S ribosomal protein L4 [archaeon]|nr:50S ribosomal protein L4 [archaeon]